MSTLLDTITLDSPETTILHREILKKKKPLFEIYREFYSFFIQSLRGVPEGPILELGSGGGFASEEIPGLLTSDIVSIPGLHAVCAAEKLPFASSSLSGIVMVNVLHHVQNSRGFFGEAARTLKEGGKIVMVEPTVTWWSRFIFKRFHHEPFDPDQQGWELPPGGRLSQANDALPWIIFCRDRRQFESEFPSLKIVSIENCLPFRYICSGGFSIPAILPNFLFNPLSYVERVVPGLSASSGLFMKIVIEKEAAIR